MLGSQGTNKQTGHDPLFLEPYDCNGRDQTFRYSLCFPSAAIMALRGDAVQEDDNLCELYADTRSDVSDYSNNEF